MRKSWYVPLQVKEGDLAVFLQGGAYEVMYQNEVFYCTSVVILMIERDDSLINDRIPEYYLL